MLIVVKTLRVKLMLHGVDRIFLILKETDPEQPHHGHQV